jgi:gliding motility-associatede transport system auxiliary component
METGGLTMTTRSQRRLSASSLVFLAVAFVAAIILSNELFRGWRIDLTENKLYTLSAGTERIIGKIDEPLNLYFYYSDSATENVPALRGYATRVREMLEEIASEAGGKINLRVIDPLPFSEDEDRASQFGLQPVQLPGSTDPVYFGLAGTNSVDDEEVIAFFQPDKEQFLEYDIARLISTLSEPQRPVIGLVSGVSMNGGFDPQSGQMSRPWVVWQQANQLFETRNLGTSFDSIDDDISLLWIVQPKALDDDTLYAIDQFLMAGGEALIFVDPVADIDQPTPPQGMPAGMPMQGQSSNLPKLFAAWGLNFSPANVVTDAQLALQLSGGRGGAPMRHFAYLGVTEQQLNADDITTAQLNTINLALAGELSLREDSELTFEPLISTSRNSSTAASTRFSYLPDPGILQNEFASSGNSKVIAARLTGKLKSAFPDGPPVSSEAADDAADSDDDSASDRPHLNESGDGSNIIVVADVDMLHDRLWAQVQNFFGQQIASAFASNGAFVINALESLAGSADLIAVRSRGSFSRPFTRVEELRVEADARYRQTEQRLQAELEETERRLGELQASREDSGNLLLTEEQQQEVDRFIDQRAQIRRDLRSVRRDLDRSIERLGTVLKVINIGLVPLLLTVVALLAVVRRKRRSQS